MEKRSMKSSHRTMTILRCKVLIIGEAGVGKTALCKMFRSGGTDYPKEYLMTVDVEYNVKVVNIPDTDVQVELYLYDCAGQPIFNSQNSKGQFPNQRHWKGSSMIALVYDVSRPETFRKCKTTLAKVRHQICKDKLTPGLEHGIRLSTFDCYHIYSHL